MSYAKIILLDDIPVLGSLGDVVTVRSGYARNKLFPARLGERYTEEAYAGFAKRKEEIRQQKDLKIAEKQQLCEKLEGYSLQVVVKADSEGKLYGSFSATNVATQLSQQGFEITKKQVKFSNVDSLKQTGDHAIKIVIDNNLVANVNVSLVLDRD